VGLGCRMGADARVWVVCVVAGVWCCGCRGSCVLWVRRVRRRAWVKVLGVCGVVDGVWCVTVAGGVVGVGGMVWCCGWVWLDGGAELLRVED